MTGSSRASQAKKDESDVALQGVYTQHLAIINDVQGVVASENICNAQGQLLVAKGASIDTKTTERILKFKLLKPIEESISIEDQLTGGGLYQRIEAHFAGDTSLRELWQLSDFRAELDEYCSRACEYNLIAQKLTVLALRYPAVFEQAMFCAWFCAQILQSKQASGDEIYEGFLAGLCHDIGMLHIDSAVINSNAKLTDAQWRQIYAHPIIGYRILTALKGFPTKVAAAVLEHHENLDGSGYPRHKVAAQLGKLGKILNLSDSINAIYRKYLKPRDRSMQDIVPIIQMSLDTRYDRTANKAIVMLRQLQGSLGGENLNQDMHEFVTKLEEFKHNIEAFLETTQHYNDAIGRDHDDLKLIALQNTLIHIATSLVQSGVIDDVSLKWLTHVKNESLAHAFFEIEQSFLMIREVFFHIESFKNHLQWYIDGITCERTKGLLVEMREMLMLLPSLDLNRYSCWGSHDKKVS